MTDTSYEEMKTVTLKLLDYCQRQDWAGYDPYDALNSDIFKALSFLDFKLFRLGLTQIMKRLPVNLRPILLIPKTENPKAIALFLAALLKLHQLGLLENQDLIPLMIQKLIDLRSPNAISSISQLATPNHYWYWGYSFPWQTRTTLVPRGAPNLVCTTFVANALLDAYERNKEPQLLNIATSASEYILNELYWERGDSVASLSYPLPYLASKTHNANFLGAALLCRVYKQTGEKIFLERALKVARYSASKQRNDGSWGYSEGFNYRWVDNFHTGYNLCALKAISEYAETSEFHTSIRRGFEFYRKHFFREDGAPKYFYGRTYPIDIHSVAQSILTLLAFKELDERSPDLAEDVLKWALTHMRDPQGYFYYQLFPYLKNRISYARWSQAWMLLALVTLLENRRETANQRL